MGKKRRGRDRLVSCDACGRLVPREKAVEYTKGPSYLSDVDFDDEVVMSTEIRVVYYCISCAKHRKIFEKKKKRAQRKKEFI